MMIDLDAQIACVAREVMIRESVYPKFVASNRMTAHRAAYEIRTMKAVLETLDRQRKPWDGVNRRNLHLQIPEELLGDGPTTINVE